MLSRLKYLPARSSKPRATLFTGRLEQKLALYRASGIPVFFGGTIFEAYAVRHQFDDYLRLLDMNKITYAEVSDGSLRMTSERKCDYIRKLSTHVQVFSEVGSKSETS